MFLTSKSAVTACDIPLEKPARWVRCPFENSFWTCALKIRVLFDFDLSFVTRTDSQSVHLTDGVRLIRKKRVLRFEIPPNYIYKQYLMFE